MGKYILLYKGKASDVSKLNEEERQEITSKWQAWIEEAGDAVLDAGSPFGVERASLVDDGSEGSASELEGFSIVEADDLQDAIDLCDGHPFLDEGKGNFAIDIYELLPPQF